MATGFPVKIIVCILHATIFRARAVVDLRCNPRERLVKSTARFRSVGISKNRDELPVKFNANEDLILVHADSTLLASGSCGGRF